MPGYQRQFVVSQFVVNGPAESTAGRADGPAARSRPDPVPLAVPAKAASTALQRPFTLATGWKRSVRRMWLDTFDWRLHRAGLSLEQVSGSSGTELALTGEGGERIAVQHGNGSWPGQIDRIPAGPVRDRLGSVVGVRALSPVARASSVLQELRVLNDDGKTVVRLVVDQMSVKPTAPGRAAGRAAGAAVRLSTRLAVAPVRGYQADADQVARALAASPAFSPADGPAADAALAAAGRRADDYTNGVDVALTASMPAARAVAIVLLRLLDTLEANVDGILRDLDTEFLHDLRVSVRRTRSALKLAGDVLPPGLAARFAPEFKWLGDLTTPTRDLDVYLLEYPAMADGLMAASPEDLAPFGDFLTRHRETEHRRLVRALRSARFAALTSGWRAALTKITRSRPSRRAKPARGAPSARLPGMTAAEIAADRVRTAYRKVVRRGSAITPESPPESLHALRKRCKELRYLLEFFASLYDPATHRQIIKQLKKLQDCLGEFQDNQVQRDAVREFARQMTDEGSAPVETLLAMGELAAQIDRRQRRARGKFENCFATFTAPDSKHRIKALTMVAPA
jgi:CHAD domain-containing protein